MRASLQSLNIHRECTCGRFSQILNTNDSGTPEKFAWRAPSMMRATLDLDRDVAQFLEPGQPLLVDRRLQRCVRHQRDDSRAMAGADPPDMEVGDAIIAGLEPRADLAFEPAVDADI